MIDFSTLQGLTIPEGVVTEIKDASGRVIWAVSGGKVILQVEKITSDTYAAETTYTGEQFILLDIYPKTNGTVTVTYGGLTKTITDTSGAEEPNAQQIYFGTLYGVSDSVATPASGELTIEGDYYAFGQSCYSQSSKIPSYRCLCITSVDSFGKITIVPEGAFGFVKSLTNVELPNSVSRIMDNAFNSCSNLISVKLPNNLETIGAKAFDATKLTDIEIPSSVTSIGDRAFYCQSTLEPAYSSIKTVKMLGNTPPELIPSTNDSTGTTTYTHFGSKELEGYSLEQIIVPKGCGNAYKTAEGWSTYADYIVEAS